MKPDTDQRQVNLLWLHCRAAFWRAVVALEPVGSSETNTIRIQCDRAHSDLRKAQLARAERMLNKRREH